MRKSLSLGSLACLLLALPLAFSSCSKETPKAKAPVDERQNRGHDEPVYAELTLREAQLKPGKTFSPESTYDDVTFTGKEQRFEITNEVQTTHVVGGYDHAEGNSHVTGSKEGATFHVESQSKAPGRVYALEITYRNAKHEPMNDQLISDEQLNRHQHFIRQVKTVTSVGYKYIDTNETSKLLYDYAYCDVFKGERNPVGLHGLIRFIRPEDGSAVEQAIHVCLTHFYGTKYHVDKETKQTYVLPYFSAKARKSDPDINLQLIFHINK